MVIYEFYWLDKVKGYQLLAVLPERRKNPGRITRNSVMNWGKMVLGDDVDSKDMFFKPIRINGICLPMTIKS